MKVDNLPGLRLTVATLALTLGGCNTLPEDGAEPADPIPDSVDSIGAYEAALVRREPLRARLDAALEPYWVAQEAVLERMPAGFDMRSDGSVGDSIRAELERRGMRTSAWDSLIAVSNELTDREDAAAERFGLFTGCAPVTLPDRLFGPRDVEEESRMMAESRLRAARLWSSPALT